MFRLNKSDKVVPGERIELSRHRWHRILSPARLPIPPSRHKGGNSIAFFRQMQEP